MSTDFLHEVCPEWEPDEFKLLLSDEPGGPLREVELCGWFNPVPDKGLQKDPEHVSVCTNCVQSVVAHLRSVVAHLRKCAKSLVAHLRAKIHSAHLRESNCF